MFEEAQLYSPVTQTDSGAVVVHLGADHPGFKDAAYRERRNEIAASALAWQPGTDPRRSPTRTPRTRSGGWSAPSSRSSTSATPCASSARRRPRSALPEDRVPQLAEVTAALAPLTGWAYQPGARAGRPARLLRLAGARRLLLDPVRAPPSQPLYTPEPDIIHEVIGHGNMLGSPRFAALKRAAGEATLRVETDAALQAIADVFWFTLEFGVMWEEGELRAYGAGILSSYGEIEEFRAMEIRPLDIAAMATVDYDITSYQPVLFGAASFGELEDVVGTFFATVDDDTPARLGIAAAA